MKRVYLGAIVGCLNDCLPMWMGDGSDVGGVDVCR